MAQLLAKGQFHRAIASYLRVDDWKRERPTHSPSLDPRFRGGDGGRAENDRREDTNGTYATPSSAFLMRQFQDEIALASFINSPKAIAWVEAILHRGSEAAIPAGSDD